MYDSALKDNGRWDTQSFVKYERAVCSLPAELNIEIEGPRYPTVHGKRDPKIIYFEIFFKIGIFPTKEWFEFHVYPELSNNSNG